MLINHEARKLTQHIVVTHADNHVGVYLVFLLVCKVILKTFQHSLPPAHHKIAGLLLLELVTLLLHIPE